MNTRAVGWMMAATALVALATTPAAGQGAIPRAADGKPDLSGIWQVLNTANFNLLAHRAEKDVPAGLGVVEGNEIPYQPAAAAKQKENFANRATVDPETKCFIPGVPRITYMPFPFQIFQTPQHIAITYEYAHVVRRIWMNSQHPDGEIPWFIGDSRGRWEEDTLVVDVKHLTDQTWLDRTGTFHSEKLHVVERYTLVNANLINYEATLDDPTVFTRPWKISMPIYRRMDPNLRLLEYECYAFGFEQLWLKPPQ